MTFWNKICGFIAIFFLGAFSSSAQVVNMSLHKAVSDSKTLPLITQSSLFVLYKNEKPGVIKKIPDQVIPQNYYTQHFGIMCKQELLIEKAIKIPFRFRLGSMQQCNYYEGK